METFDAHEASTTPEQLHQLQLGTCFVLCTCELESGLGSALALEKSSAHCPTAEMHGQHGSVPGTGEQTGQRDGRIKLRLSKIGIVRI